MELFRTLQQTGNSGVVIMSGLAGCGKTCLVREALKKMARDGALTVSAKVDQFTSDTPYTAIVGQIIVI
jgi:predicted ATPase